MKKNLVSFVQKHFVAVVSTHSKRPHGTPIYYFFVEEDNAFYFITKSETRKIVDIKINKKASLTIFTEDPPVVFTANCVTELPDFESDEYVNIISKLVELHSIQKYYPTPISTLKDGDLSLVKLNIKSATLKSYEKKISLLNAYRSGASQP